MEHPLEDFISENRLDRFNEVLDNRTDQVTIVLDRIRNYHNVSAVIRSADAFGINSVHLVGGNFEYTKGVSKGTERWIELQKHEDIKSVIQKLEKENYKIVVLQPEEKKEAHPNLKILPVTKLPFNEKLALVFGNEKHSVDKKYIDAATYGAFIPMFGFVDSFNISVACAITLFCSTLKNTEINRTLLNLSKEKKEKIKDSWLKKDVRESEKY